MREVLPSGPLTTYNEAAASPRHSRSSWWPQLEAYQKPHADATSTVDERRSPHAPDAKSSPPATRPVPTPVSLRASVSLPALLPQQLTPPSLLSTERPVATPFVEQVKRLQTPALASTRLSPSRGRARDRARVRRSHEEDAQSL